MVFPSVSAKFDIWDICHEEVRFRLLAVFASHSRQALGTYICSVNQPPQPSSISHPKSTIAVAAAFLSWFRSRKIDEMQCYTKHFVGGFERASDISRRPLKTSVCIFSCERQNRVFFTSRVVVKVRWGQRALRVPQRAPA